MAPPRGAHTWVAWAKRPQEYVIVIGDRVIIRVAEFFS